MVFFALKQLAVELGQEYWAALPTPAGTGDSCTWEGDQDSEVTLASGDPSRPV